MTPSSQIWNLFDLTGRVALVTGGVRDLGLQMASALAQAGATVAVTSRSDNRLADCHAHFRAIGRPEPRFYAMDVLDEGSVRATVRSVNQDLGRIDILLNNAGGTPTSDELENRSIDDWNRTFAVNVTGTFLACKHVAPIMKAQRSGKIINIASMSGMLGRDQRMYEGSDMRSSPPDYQAAKAAVINLTRDVAARLGKYNVNVNCISPGGFQRNQPAEFIRRYSQRTMLDRMGRDGIDLMGATVFLASAASDYVTGHNLVVDGGYTAW